MDRINETAYPRVGLAGNPSDLYGGRGLGFTFDAWSAEVSLEPVERLDLGAGDPAGAPLSELLRAGWAVFREHAGDVAEPDPGLGTPLAEPGAGVLRAGEPGAADGSSAPADPPGADGSSAPAAAGATLAGDLSLLRAGRPWLALRPFAVRARTDVPRQAGLSGSSAILVAFVRALARGAGLHVPPHRVAQLAWRAEVERLGIRAGPLDRLVQAHEGLLAMDFARPWDPSATRRLHADGLPPLCLAVDPSPGRASGDVHAPVFARWQAGDARVAECLEGWRALADRAREAVERGDGAALAEVVDANLDLRVLLFRLAEGDRRAVEVARAHGAAAKLCGSGGAVCCVPRERLEGARVDANASAPADANASARADAQASARANANAPALADALRAEGYAVVSPRVVGPTPARGRLRAVVLAAGFATRLYPLTRTCAKPLLELHGAPLLTRLVRQLAATGAVHDVVVVTNGRFHADFEAWRDGLERSTDHADAELPILELVCDGVTDDSANLGAVADLQLALSRAPTPAEPLDGYVILAGDNLLDVSLEPFTRRLLERRRPQLVVRRLPEPVPPGRYSEVTLAADGSLAGYREKPADPGSPLSALPLYLLTPELPELVDAYLERPGAERDAPGHLLAWLTARRAFDVLPVGGRWFDIGDRTQLQVARDWLAARDGTPDVPECGAP